MADNSVDVIISNCVINLSPDKPQVRREMARVVKPGGRVDTVIAVCGNANQACPVFPSQLNRHHWPFFDPAKATGSDEEVMNCFRQVRDEMRRVFEAYAEGLRDGKPR